MNRCQDHIHNRLLNDLVLQCSKRSCPGISTRRQRPVRSPTMQARVQIEQALVQTLAVDTCRGFLLQTGRPKRIRRESARSFGFLSAAPVRRL